MSIPTGVARRIILANLGKSMSEEATAARRYRARARIAAMAGDTVTAKLYLHIAREEDVHWGEFDARRKRIAGSH